MQEEITFRPLEARIYLNDGVFCAISDATSDLFDVVQVARQILEVFALSRKQSEF